MTKDTTLEDGMKNFLSKADNVSEDIQQFAERNRSDTGKPGSQTATPKTAQPSGMPHMKARVAMTIKLRSDVAAQLKRYSVLSQLEGEKITMQAIAEEAIEQWLSSRV